MVARLALSVLGIYACFLTWGVLQERVTTTTYGPNKDRFKHFIFLNLVQSLIASLVAFFYLLITRQPLGDRSPSLLGQYAQVAFFQAVASPFGYAALKHIDYPTMILGKSCKLVPVMFMNIILYRRRFPLHKYITVFLVTVGVSIFMLLQPVDPSKKKNVASSSLWGIFLLTVNLLIDGVTNSTQDHVFHRYRVSGQQMMFYMNLFSSLLMALWLLNPWNPEFSSALQFLQTHPKIVMHILLFAGCGACGQLFIFYTLEQYGSLVLVTVTVTRKLFTMVLSVFYFGHVLTLGQWGAVFLVFAGIGLEAYVKRAEKLAKMEKKRRVTEANRAVRRLSNEISHSAEHINGKKHR
ncbi:uncharacterized protein VTP21DRAFT_3929 [Calcarisporiella thermophila]|uniref:uncharacterized protein n=1 Tax=Calcarisporiella thermophila TaxID=911321 RepID=UPI0037439A91